MRTSKGLPAIVTMMLTNVVRALSLACIAALILVTVVSVGMRYFVQRPFGWSEEISLLLFVWLVMTGAASAEDRDEHVSIDILVETLSQKTRLCLHRIERLITVVSFVTVTILSVQLSVGAWEKLTPVLFVPYTLIDIAIPIGLLSMLVFRLRNKPKSGAR